MRFLLLCTKFPTKPGETHLTNQLALALGAAGHTVTVVAIDWANRSGALPHTFGPGPGVTVLAVPPSTFTGAGRFIERATKWLFSPLRAVNLARKHLAREEFDAILCISPCTAVSACLVWAVRRFRTFNVLLIHDFFPFHHRSIGLLRGPAFVICRFLEGWLMRKFHVLAPLLPSNIEYLKAHYRIRPQQRLTCIPIWTSLEPITAPPRDTVRTAFGLPLDRTIVVFGGQITEGRGIEEILVAAAIAERERPDLFFLFVGDGRLTHLIQAKLTGGASNIGLISRIPTNKYQELLSACNVGLAVTVRGVESFSFPSKTLDYLKVGIPIVGAVEEGNDYHAFVRDWGVGRSVAAGAPHALVEAITSVVDDLDFCRDAKRNAWRCLHEVFDVNKIATRIVSLIPCVPPHRPG